MFKFNFWPYLVISMIVGSIIASSWTIKIAVTNPVQQSNLFLENYHITDKNINEIIADQLIFNSKYKLDISNLHFSETKIYGNISITENEQVVETEFQTLITRPETTKLDTQIENGTFDFKITKSGRWLIYIKADVQNLTGYYYLELDNRELGDIQVLNPFISHKKIEKIALEKAERIRQLLE